MSFKAIWPTAPRDFLVLTTWAEQDDGSIIISVRSPPNNDTFPLQKGYVRGYINISGYHIQPHETITPRDPEVPPGYCRLSICVHSELGGTLPVSIINILATAAPMKMLTAIGKIVGK
jgi:hypothetical protein